ncbi:hypothetical protein NQT62_11100 [Limnobacter humi]|uniref:Metallopeptidase domain-containing protein n=1 Tax=Limnobacter humi TaxID=1778671 RepID=A0ABT1WKB7_9BURK|nr:hypothetical protein [Limnobacter humi]MCQ8896979.1 hypothetical protein [Limnobacter humi]
MVFKRVVCGLFALLAMPTHAASSRDLDSTLSKLQAVVPGLHLKIAVAKTYSRAFVNEESSPPELTVDPDFLSQLQADAVLFMVAHEYAHVHMHHQKKLGEKAMALVGLPDPDRAFDALETQPVLMEQLNTVNRQFELDADEQARKWLAQLGVQACTEDVLRSIDGGEFAMMPITNSHPGFYQRRKVICAGNAP